MFLLTIVGFLIGILVVSLGGGGGLAYVGILVASFHIPPEIAASTSLATIIPTTLVGTISHAYQKNVRVKLSFMMIPTGIIGVLAGSFMMHGINPLVAKKIFGIIMLLLSIPMIISVIRPKPGSPKGKGTDIFSCPNVFRSMLYGLMAGIMTGAVGLSGTAPIIIGLISLGCSTLEVVGTSLSIIFILSVAGFLTHLSLGVIDWKIIGWLLGGTIPGALMSPWLLKKIKKEYIERFGTPILIVIILVSGILLVAK